MNLELADHQKLMQESFAGFLNKYSSLARVRAAAGGFDRELWLGLAQLGVFGMRVPEQAGGSNVGTLDVAILMEEVGRTLASGPIAEAILGARVLALLGSAAQSDVLARVLSGTALVTLAYRDLAEEPVQWVAGGAVAEFVITCDGDDVVLLDLVDSQCGEPNLAASPIAELRLRQAPRSLLASGHSARAIFQQAIEEWKLLMAAALIGLSRQAIRMAAAYAGERKAFGQFIGTFQAISHPLAVTATDTEASKYFVWKTICDIEDGSGTAGAQVPLALWSAIDAAGRGTSQAIQTFGGYGLTTDFDIHLYNLRARAWPLLFGDPEQLLEEAGARLYAGEQAELPDVGEVTVDWDRGEEARQLAADLSSFFEQNLTPELKAKAHFSWSGHDPEFHKKLASAGLLFPDWPPELGGRNASPYALTSATEVYRDYDWTTTPASVSRMVGEMIRRFGSDDLKSDLLARISAGEAICCLGWTEPGGGSDVFAAQTRAVPDGNGWRIDGQKMFTSGADIADYVYMIVRTNPDVPKHKGVTMFVVPLDTPGISIQPINSFQDERTNITFYEEVQVPDKYRIGEVDGGLAVMSATLEIEHSASYAKVQQQLLTAGEQLCREVRRRGEPLIERRSIQARLARIFGRTQLAIVLNERMLWAAVEKKAIPACGPMARMQSADAFFEAACELLNLTAPHSLSKRSGAAEFVNRCYRHAHAARIYGGSQEIQRSQIAERFLDMPRTRA